MNSTNDIVVPSYEALIAEARPKAKQVRHYQATRIDRFGKVAGSGELAGKTLPADRVDHWQDDHGDVLITEHYTRDFSRPSLRFYHYETGQVHEMFMASRYGELELYARYAYDPGTALMTWRAEYNQDGGIHYYVLSTYDERRQLKEERFFNGRNEAFKRWVYTYYPDGKIETWAKYDGLSGHQGTMCYRYDKRGNVMEGTWRDPAGRPRSRYAYTYDTNKHLTKLELYNAKGQVIGSQTFAYDRAGNAVDERWFDSAGKLCKNLHFESAAV